MNETAFDDGIAHDAGHDLAGTDGVVVAWNDVLDQVWVTVGVDHSDDRDTELVGFGNGDVFFADIKNEDCIGQLGHILDTAQVALQLDQFAALEQCFLFRH